MLLQLSQAPLPVEGGGQGGREEGKERKEEKGKRRGEWEILRACLVVCTYIWARGLCELSKLF